MEETMKQFIKSAAVKFGNKIKVIESVEDLGYYYASQDKQPPPTKEELATLLPAVIPVDNKCPVCGELLQYSFEWKIQHGLGFCGGCNKVEFLYYRYIRDNKVRIIFYELEGF